MNELHVVFGAGQVGARLAERLLADGRRVRVVRRGPGGPAREGLEWRSGDVLDEAFAVAAAEGAAAVYNCVNPPYHRWPELLPPMVRHVRAAATRAGARLVVLDNVYAYGPTSGAPMTEATPLGATSKKGALRRALFLEQLEAHRRGEVRVGVVKAADFAGPGVDQSAVFQAALYRALLAGRPATVVVDPETPHSYTDVRDVVEVLATLGRSDAGLGRAWHVPTAEAISTRAWLERLAAALGGPLRLRRLPPWVIRAAGLVSPLVRELPEMAYQWRAPFHLDGSDFTRTFGLAPRAIDDTVAAAAAWARERWGAPAPVAAAA